MLVGIDDTDSIKGGCTTYLASLLCKKFKTKGYPKLIRLNPNIPYKTRGNGAVSINIKGNEENIKNFVLRLVEKYAHLNNTETNPGVVFINTSGSKEKHLLNNLYLKAVSQLVKVDEADKIAEKISAEVYKFNNGRGVIGALAALAPVLEDRTYEFIAYRNESVRGPRRLDLNSVFEMNGKTYPRTYDNVDFETRQVLITPRGYNPLFCGIRGETPAVVERAWSMLKPLEDIALTQVFESNQGTDAHLRPKRISDIRPYDCVMVEGVVSKQPKTIVGGHVLFGVSDESGFIWCAAYEPTGAFRGVARKLIVGDVVRCFGGVGRYSNTVNLEKFFISRLSSVCVVVVPNCCGKKMTSAGRNKGYKCRKCGKKLPQSKVKIRKIKRNVKQGWYEVPPRARRHLSKPLIRQI